MIMFVIDFYILRDIIEFLNPNCNISVQLAREQAQKTVNQGMQSETSDTSNAAVSSAATSTAANAASSNTSLTSNGLASSPASVTPIASADPQQLVSGLSSTPGVEPSTVVTTTTASIAVAGPANSLDSTVPSMYKTMFCIFTFFLLIWL